MEELINALIDEDNKTIADVKGVITTNLIDELFKDNNIEQGKKSKAICKYFDFLDSQSQDSVFLEISEKILEKDEEELEFSFKSEIICHMINKIESSKQPEMLDLFIEEKLKPLFEITKGSYAVLDDVEDLLGDFYQSFFKILPKDEQKSRFPSISDMVMNEKEMGYYSKSYILASFYRYLARDISNDEVDSIIEQLLDDNRVKMSDKYIMIKSIFSDKYEKIKDKNLIKDIIIEINQRLSRINGLDERTQILLKAGIFEMFTFDIKRVVYPKLIEELKKYGDNIYFTGDCEDIYKHLYHNIPKEEQKPGVIIYLVNDILSNEDIRDFHKGSIINKVLDCFDDYIVKENLPRIIATIANDENIDSYDKSRIISDLCTQVYFNYDYQDIEALATLVFSFDAIDDYDKERCIFDIWKEEFNNLRCIKGLPQLFEFFKNSNVTKGYNLGEYLLEYITSVKEIVVQENLDLLLGEIDLINEPDFDKLFAYRCLALKLIELKNNDNAGKIISAIKENGYDNEIDCSSIESFQKNIVLKELDDYCLEKWKDKEHFEKQNIVEGLKIILNEDNVKIFENPNIIQFMTSLIDGDIELPFEKDTKELTEIYSKLISNLKEPEKLEEYKKMIEDGSGVPENQKEHFLEQMNLHRLKEGRLPKVFYNYLIKETILGNIDKNENLSLMQGVIIDLTRDTLEDAGIFDYKVGFRKLEEYTLGQHIYGGILFSSDYFKSLSIVEMINTCFHECRHAFQRRAIDNQVLDKKVYKMLKESVIEEFDSSFYDRNYMKMENEFDARVFAALKTNEFLLSLGIDAATIAKFQDVSLEAEIKRDKEQNRNKKKDRKDRERNINEIVIDALNSNQEKISEVFYEKPLLNLEFEVVDNKFVRRKSREAIQADMEVKLAKATSEAEQMKIEELYKYILNGEPEIDFSSISHEEYLRQNGYDITGEIQNSFLGNLDGGTGVIVAGTGAGATFSFVSFARRCFDKHTDSERRDLYSVLFKLGAKEKEQGNKDESLLI